MILAALLASGAALFLGGFLVGLYVNRGIRRIPEHPSLHRPTTPNVFSVGPMDPPRIRVMDGPYDWKNEG